MNSGLAFFLATLCCLAIGLAQDKPEGEVLSQYERNVVAINWLQNIADGNWVVGGDVGYLTKAQFGSRRMLTKDAEHLALNVVRLRKRWGGLAIFLRGYEYEDVKMVWDALFSESKKAGLYREPMMVVDDFGEGGKPNFRKTSIRDLHHGAEVRARSEVGP